MTFYSDNNSISDKAHGIGSYTG